MSYYESWTFGSAATHDWRPLNYGNWIRIEIQLFYTMLQIIASIVVLALGKHEQQHMPLRIWIIGYLTGCAATLPLMWCYYRLQRQTSLQMESAKPLIDCFTTVLCCFFLAWFFVGWVFIGKGGSARSEAPSLYWLSLALLIFSALEYLLWIVVGTFCCDVPSPITRQYI